MDREMRTTFEGPVATGSLVSVEILASMSNGARVYGNTYALLRLHCSPSVVKLLLCLFHLIIRYSRSERNGQENMTHYVP